MYYKTIKSLQKCLLDFEEQLKNIREFSNMSTLLENLVPKVLNANKTSLLYKSIKDDINSLQKQIYASKTLYYNATIVSLYGAYERAIKIALEIYADYLKLKCTDEKEKEKLLGVNYDISTDALKRPQDYRLEDSDIIRVLENLTKVKTSQSVEHINVDLLFKKQANLKLKVLNQMFAYVSLNETIDKAKKSYQYLSVVKEQKGLKNIDEAKKYVETDICLIDELVDRRNTVSHEGRESNMISQEMIISDYASRIEAFVSAIILDMISRVMLKMSEEKLLYLLDATWFSRELIGVKTRDCVIDNQSIILILGDGVRCSPVLSMMHKDDFIESSEGYDEVGIKLIRNCKETYKYYALPRQ